MKSNIWRGMAIFALLIGGAMLLNTATVNGGEKKLLSEEEMKIKQTETEAWAKESIAINEMKAKSVEILQKWAKEADFEKMGKEIVDYAKSKDLIATSNIKEAGRDTDIMVPKFLFVKIMSPLLENVSLQFKDVPIGDIISSFLTFGDYVFPESNGLADKKITCNLRNIERIKALNLVLRANNYSLACVFKESEEQEFGFQQLYYRVKEVGLFEISDYSYLNGWCLSRDILTEQSEEYARLSKSLADKFKYSLDAAVEYQWIMNNYSKLSQYYMMYLKNKTDEIVKSLNTEFKIIIKTGW
jgi:hypothetical protein